MNFLKAANFNQVPGTMPAPCRLSPSHLALGLVIALVSPLADAAASAATEGAAYPRTLTGAEIVQHFSTYSRMNANTSKRPFTLTISRREVQRDCPTCKNQRDNGRLSFKEGQNLVCMDWNKVSYPASGCFNVIQTSEATFELKDSAGNTAIAYTIAGTASSAGLPGQGTPLSRTITFRASATTTDTQRLLNAGQKALRLREWSIENCSKDCLRGRLIKSGVSHWVEIRVQAPFVEIGFIAGTQEGKPGWLENLKKDMLTVLNQS